MEPDAAAVAVRAFAVDLFRDLAGTPGNAVCSPYSIAVALAMTRLGARGRTAEEMDAVLHAAAADTLRSSMSRLSTVIAGTAGVRDLGFEHQVEVDLAIANSLWAQRGLPWEPGFVAELDRFYDAAMETVDYVAEAEAARQVINRWTSDRTHGRIPEILARGIIDGETRLVLVNAIYLKAPWREPFVAARTQRAPFVRSDGTTIEVDMMAGGLHEAALAEGPGWRAAQVPYADGALAMSIVLPDGNLRDLTKGLDAATLTAMLTRARSLPLLDLRLPRWRSHQASSLNDTLINLGMGTAFTGQADFSGMTTAQRLLLRAVLHDAFVSVDEQGTEAAAATAGVVVRLSMPRPIAFVVDQPFLFVIHDVETATPLFIGRVDDPTVES